MKKYLIITAFITSVLSGCGIVNDTTEETYDYTYILKNETGETLRITSDFGRTELVPDGEAFQCVIHSAPSGFLGGLCSGELEIRIPNTNKGFHCFRREVDDKGLCFEDGQNLFTRLDGTIFTEISSRTYKYVLTPDLLEGAYQLPEE